jgi:hypothetical protein
MADKGKQKVLGGAATSRRLAGLDVCFVSQAPVHGEENVMPA